ncbi:MAG: hypothetical protein K9J13_15160 [Saprospiraceae bacterium]|nr:hypothetical protein [Saprospiraceae bacterium]
MTHALQDIELNKYFFPDTAFQLLMKRRIHKVLLICSNYDAFLLEEDGRIDEQIFNEYVSLNLRYPPQFIHASNIESAFQKLEEENIDLVITMLSTGDIAPFELSKKIKLNYPIIPIVVLTPFSREVSLEIDNQDFTFIDYIFSWLGDADILLAIIKLIEDKMNVEYDVNEVGVQVIILVEDSIRFYSSYLPNIYKIIFTQSKKYMTEGLNEHEQMLRMRGRPKILLATTYEEAVQMYNKYKLNLLGIISDINYNREGESDEEAGIKLCKMVRNEDVLLPFLLQSSQGHYEEIAKKLGVGFINKNSKSLSFELREYIIKNFAFGDFVFLDPKTNLEINRAFDLQSFQQKLFEISDETLRYHISRNHFSKWLNARALFPIAEIFKYLRIEHFNDLDDIRRYIIDTIANYRHSKGRGVIAKFYKESFDEYLIFSRIGDGSLGGKARGLAFIESLLKRNNLIDKYPDILITIPRTVVLTTDVFDEFMEENQLYDIALSNLSDSEILNHFVKSNLPFRIHEDLLAFLSVIDNPIAIRSSSLLEDSHYQPFAGIYSTYMIPNIKDNERIMVDLLCSSIKSVYASVYFKDSKAYMAATKNLIDEEKMGIVLQEVCGSQYKDSFYPTISGVARSLNFYPIHPEKQADGIANIAFGLGKHIVDGGVNLRFSPKYPKKIIQLSSPQMALRTTQKEFYALDLSPESYKVSTDDSINLKKFKIKDIKDKAQLKHVASTYDINNNIIRDGVNFEGRKLITFSNILKHNTFPLAEILDTLLKVGQKEMNNPIEIEFAVDLNVPKGNPIIFSFLQIRPIVESNDSIKVNIDNIKVENTIVTSESSLGNGVIKGIYDLVYVKPETFNAAKSTEIALQVEMINNKFIEADKNYILIGPGRWGSSDPWLGVPVKWPQISAARLIVESGLKNYRIDPSQGTHFFQNLTSFQVGYFTINPYVNDGFYDVDYLNTFKAEFENEFIRHIKFEKPLVIKIDGRKNKGVILKSI